MNHQNNFTLLRVILAILIIVTHGYGITGHPYEQPIPLDSKIWANLRLNMFFFISGYLVTGSALASKSNVAFVIKRLLRIYPALIITVLLTIFVLGPLFSTYSVEDYFSHTLTWKYLFTMSGFHIEYSLPGVFVRNPYSSVNASLWTITLELKLYLLLLLSLVSGFIFTRIYKWFALLTALICIIFAITGYTIEGTAYNTKVWQLIAIYQAGSAMQVFRFSLKKICIALIISVVFISLRILDIIPYPVFIDQLVFYSSFTLLLAYLPKLRFPLKTDISYGLFLYGFPVQQILIQLSHNKMHPAINIVTAIFVTGCIAFLSWKYIEKPALSLKKFL